VHGKTFCLFPQDSSELVLTFVAAYDIVSRRFEVDAAVAVGLALWRSRLAPVFWGLAAQGQWTKG